MGREVFLLSYFGVLPPTFKQQVLQLGVGRGGGSCLLACGKRICAVLENCECACLRGQSANASTAWDLGLRNVQSFAKPTIRCLL